MMNDATRAYADGAELYSKQGLEESFSIKPRVAQSTRGCQTPGRMELERLGEEVAQICVRRCPRGLEDRRQLRREPLDEAVEVALLLPVHVQVCAENCMVRGLNWYMLFSTGTCCSQLVYAVLHLHWHTA